jgi:hypothetical protein
MASIARFVSRRERISRQKAADARQAVLDLQCSERVKLAGFCSA